MTFDDEDEEGGSGWGDGDQHAEVQHEIVITMMTFGTFLLLTLGDTRCPLISNDLLPQRTRGVRTRSSEGALPHTRLYLDLFGTTDTISFDDLS